MSGSIHVSSGDIILFIFKAKEDCVYVCACVYMCTCVGGCMSVLFIINTSDGHRSVFHFLVIVNSAAMNRIWKYSNGVLT